MAPDHPKMVLGVHRDRMHESKVSLDGFTIRNPRFLHPSLESSISIATILKIPKLQDYLVLAVVVRELSEHQGAFLFDCCVFIARFTSSSCYSSAKTRIRPVKSYQDQLKLPVEELKLGVDDNASTLATQETLVKD